MAGKLNMQYTANVYNDVYNGDIDSNSIDNSNDNEITIATFLSMIVFHITQWQVN